MKIGIFSDVHANLDAFEAVMQDMHNKGIRSFVCLGDIVGYGANPKECIELVKQIGCPVVRGNHDHYCGAQTDLSAMNAAAAMTITWTREQLSDEERDYLITLPMQEEVENFTIVHSSLDSPESWPYVFDQHFAEDHFQYQKTSLCFCGHTHVPLAFELADSVRFGLYQKVRIKAGNKYLINVGSVGQPRDGDPRAAYAVYDVYENLIELHRVAYDIKSAADKITAAGLPAKNSERLFRGK